MRDNRQIIVVIVGIEYSGKTTLGHMLATRLGFAYLPEIGGKRRQVANSAVFDACEAFDEAVMMDEFRRDEEVLSAITATGVILEQWHLGNLAFACVRTPRVASEYFIRLKRLLKSIPSPFIIFLELNPAHIFERKGRGVPLSSQKTLEGFYKSWNRQINHIMHEFGLDPLRIDALLSPEAVADIAEMHIRKRMGGD